MMVNLLYIFSSLYCLFQYILGDISKNENKRNRNILWPGSTNQQKNSRSEQAQEKLLATMRHPVKKQQTINMANGRTVWKDTKNTLTYLNLLHLLPLQVWNQSVWRNC